MPQTSSPTPDPSTPDPAWGAHLPPGVSAADVPARLLARRSLPAAWAARWAAEPRRPVLREVGSPWVTAAELEARSAAMAGRLRRAGLEPGDRILMSAAPSVDLVVAHVGALRAGLVVVPANTGYRREEIGHLVTDSEPRAALTDDAERGGWCADASPGREVLLVGPDVALPDGRRPVLDDEVIGPDSPALIGYTSGTTGRPKGAVLSHGNLLASVEALLLAWRWTAEDRLALALPLFHMHGLGVGVHGTLAAGASAVLVGRFDVDAVLDAAAQERASLFFGVPTMYERLVGSPRAAELGRLRLCVSGSAPMPADLHERFEAASGQRALERYGMTETVMLVSNPYDGERRAGTVGLPLPGVDLRLSPDRGEVLVRGPNVFGGYRNQPEANETAFDARFEGGGWFRTGDLGALDPDGYLRLVGRAKELIISGGYNVYPREIEDALRLHPAILDAAVVGSPDRQWGEVVTAYVELDHGDAGRTGRPSGGFGDGLDEEALRRFLDDRLAAYKRPRIYHVVEALPRNALGKIQKHLLAGS